MTTLSADKVYRLAWNMDRRDLRGAAVAFIGWREATAFDIRRARVMVIGNHPQRHAEYLVNASVLIPA